MITRVFKGKSPYGLVKYLYGEGRRNEHTDIHLVASWDGNPQGLEPEYVEALGRHHVAPLVELLEQPVRASDRAPKQWVYHLVLRNEPTDRRLSDEEWAQVATSAMDAAGIAPHGDPSSCRWVAVRHAEDHLHIVATLVREDGAVPNTWGDFGRLRAVAQSYEDKFGLYSTAGREDKTASPRPGVKEQISATKAGYRRPPRVALAERVQTAAASSAGFGDFTRRLAEQGITVWPRMSERNPEEITGYSVSVDGWTNGAGEPIRFGGGKLAPDLSWPKLRARWDPETAPGAAAGASSERADGKPPRTDRPTPAGAGGPLSGEDAAQVWREAERIVREAAEKIAADAAGNPEAAADAAWAASDALAAAAAGVEGRRGGPLTDASRVFARAGRETYRRVPQRSDTGTALRSAGRMIAMLAPTSKHPAAAQAALTTALAALAAAVADLRRAQQRAHQADAALAAAVGLQAVRVPQPVGVPRPGEKRTAAQIAALSFNPGWRENLSKPADPVPGQPKTPPPGPTRRVDNERGPSL